MDFLSVDGAKEFIDKTLEHIRVDTARNSGLRPIAILVTPGTPADQFEVRLYDLGALGDFTQESKELIAKGLRASARNLNAVASVVATEAWFVTESTDVGRTLIKGWVGSLENYPGRIETVVAAYEHQTTGRQLWVAPMHREGRRVTLGEFKNLGGAGDGRFFNIIPSTIPNKKEAIA